MLGISVITMNNTPDNTIKNIEENLSKLSNNDKFFHEKLIEHEVKFHFIQMQLNFLLAFISHDQEIQGRFALFAKALSVSESESLKNLRDVATGLLEGGLQHYLTPSESQNSTGSPSLSSIHPFVADNIIQFPNPPTKR